VIWKILSFIFRGHYAVFVSVVAADVAECDRAVVRHVPERSALRGIESQPIHDDARRSASCVQ